MRTFGIHIYINLAKIRVGKRMLFHNDHDSRHHQAPYVFASIHLQQSRTNWKMIGKFLAAASPSSNHWISGIRFLENIRALQRSFQNAQNTGVLRMIIVI